MYIPRLTVLVAACALSLAGCSTLATDTKPQFLRSYEPTASEEPEVGPQPGQEPDLLLREFFSASAIPTGDYAAARAFLAPSIRQTWAPDGNTLVVNAVDITTVFDSSNSNRRVFTVRGSVIGTLEEGGSYLPENGAYEAEITMEKIQGEWRVTDLPQNVVIERTELRNQYQPQNLYFYESTGSSLIADRRWIFSGENSLNTELVTMIMEGPSARIKPAVADIVPRDAIFAGMEGGVYRFTGMADMDESQRRRFAAQLVWTLSNAGVPGPYSATADGTNLVPDVELLTTDDFVEFNPRTSADSVPALYAVIDANVHSVMGNEATPVAGPLGASGEVQSAEVSANGVIAAVRVSGNGKSQLVIGELGGPLIESIEGRTLSRPSLEHDRDAAWIVVDGTTVVRLVPSSDKNRIVEREVNTSALEGIPGEISVLRLSPAGARVAMIIDGRIFTGVVTRVSPGETRIVNVHELATELGGTALTLDWQPDGSLIVGTSTPEAPVWRLEQDGSSLSMLPAGNITAPVVSIAANRSTIYATDARTMLQFSPSETDAVFWREVPGLQGLRAAPIVAD
ncbi:lipoprotein LpqB [Corynebacterium phocae]|uniref:Lipoprotein LpqB n=1 Tax=Corynebacterium phocae TaxID=161895 RepID=A0A1L7D4X4_9CORY|nr:MtrAB system accessory lipoprotein LpqB [Corynebacterium phocae]APT93091.1 lipoprotein LpqB [Corynebacterium phocae]KAA8722394.1 MtrAB system accessory protein LpqB [Corynebacterium phocae]